MTLQTQGFGSLFGLSTKLSGLQTTWSTQTQWAINESTGDDSGVGTPVAPLRTMGELNRRLSFPTQIAQPTTVQLQTNISDAPMLNGTGFTSAGTLTFTGTSTVAASGSVVAVTALGPSSTFPYSMQTSGLDWTAVTARKIRFNTGNVGFVARVIDANNVEIGAIGQLTTSGTAPVNGNTFTVESLSTCAMPVVQAIPILSLASPIVIFDSISFAGSGALQIMSGPVIRFFGCEINHASGAQAFWNAGGNGLRFCLVRGNGINGYSGVAQIILTGCVFVGGTIRYVRGTPLYTNCFHSNCPIIVNELSYVRSSGLNIRNTAAPIVLTNGARWFNLNVALAGGSNTGVGITVSGGCGFTYASGGSGKPTLTGGSDTVIGGVTRTYTQIPFTDLQLDAIPPTVTTLVGTGAFMVQE